MENTVSLSNLGKSIQQYNLSVDISNYGQIFRFDYFVIDNKFFGEVFKDEKELSILMIKYANKINKDIQTIMDNDHSRRLIAIIRRVKYVPIKYSLFESFESIFDLFENKPVNEQIYAPITTFIHLDNYKGE